MKTILSEFGHFVISGPDRKDNAGRYIIYMQSVKYTEPTLYDLVSTISNECFSNINHKGLDLEESSIHIRLTANDGKEYDLIADEPTSIEELETQILQQINI